MRVNEWHPKKEAVESSFKPGRYDVAKDAVEWLTLFRIQNAGKFKDLVVQYSNNHWHLYFMKTIVFFFTNLVALNYNSKFEYILLVIVDDS